MSNRTSILAAGLRWLYGTEQPADAVLSHHGISVSDPDAGANRWYSFVPSGALQRPVVVVHVSRPEWAGTGTGMYPANPLDVDELVAVQLDLATLDVVVHGTWNGFPGHSGSVGLTRPARPSLLAAVDRYRAGCADHLGQILCSWDGCPWYAAGEARIVRPQLIGGAV